MLRFFAFFLLLPAARAAANGTEEAEFIRVWPEKLVVESGGFVVLNCSSNCDGIGLETSLNQVPAGNGRTWKAFNLTSVNQWAPTPLCYAQCTSSNIQPQRAEITVYQAPKHVVLDPVPEMEVGKPYNLTCRVSSVAPIRNLIVTLLKGGEELLVETFENHTVPAATDALVTHQIIAQQDDHRAEITCHAALDLRPEGPLFERASDNESLVSVDNWHGSVIVLTVFSSDPHLEAPLVMETNTTMAVHCHVSGVFPAEEAQFDLQFAGKSWNLSTSVSGSSVSAQALVSSSSTGEHTLLCTVSLGRVSRRVEKTVNVYSLPKPILGIDQPKILVNQSVLITCRCNETGCSGTVMHLSDGKHLLVNGHPPFLQYALTTRKEDDGREFTCQVARMVDGHPVAKETLVSQETNKMVWYSLPFKNLPQFVVIHTIKGFSIVSEAEVDVFLELPSFLHDPAWHDMLFCCQQYCETTAGHLEDSRKVRGGGEHGEANWSIAGTGASLARQFWVEEDAGRSVSSSSGHCFQQTVW
ncbi:Intercellular adhesion molecule 5 [Varanus komodoensis]|nr:Intercellular adhesion molecule 5 [Varanus komodoensis]